jgi:hypothetical protein
MTSNMAQHPKGSSIWRRVLALWPVPGDQLIANVVEVVADDVRPRFNFQHIVAGAFDRRGLPARLELPAARIAV